ncbi:hypothetical protein TraAM80_06340 [Trypanosoma rangeli]|uniref:Uncharacterized protein n=1 Tax=Trypanosoma rangeli TaxID=5698 RepID=A0A422NAN0_TRYRA|nr:uncharacterized protein TraAM80_06340 [Trypanosoma rangeli]RNF02515.1 hypothetical protein TraAM80_06340 [Trypanosoma rangeli]|eukprot:RNF02515.1 hypothetical protein TraAM80_06340 [Trypanosoma rangeli]
MRGTRCYLRARANGGELGRHARVLFPPTRPIRLALLLAADGRTSISGLTLPMLLRPLTLPSVRALRRRRSVSTGPACCGRRPNPMRTIPYDPMAPLSVERSLAVPSFRLGARYSPIRRGGWQLAGARPRGGVPGHGNMPQRAPAAPTARIQQAGDGCIWTRCHPSVHFKRGPNRVTDGVLCRMGSSTISLAC